MPVLSDGLYLRTGLLTWFRVSETEYNATHPLTGALIKLRKIVDPSGWETQCRDFSLPSRTIRFADALLDAERYALEAVLRAYEDAGSQDVNRAILILTGVA